MYDYIERITKTTKLPMEAVRDSDGSELDEELYNKELLRLQRSGLHLIVSRPVVLQTMDVLQWIAMHVDFKCMAVVSDKGKIVASLAPSNLHNMYHLKQVEAKCNKEYLDGFNVKFLKSYKLMKDWYREEESFKDRAGITKYNPEKFNSPAQFFTAMLSCLHGEVDCTKFKSERIPIEHGLMYASIIFNWASMLSQNILKALERAMQKTDPKGITFYFSAYLMDVLCDSNSFPGMKWAWNPQIPPIHLYCILFAT